MASTTFATSLSARETAGALKLWMVTAFRAAPMLVLAQCVLAALMAVTAPAQTYGVKLLVDGLTGKASGLITTGVVVILAGFAVTFVGNVISGPVQDTTAERVAGRIYSDVLGVTASVPSIIHHERRDVADKVELIREQAWRLGVSFEMLLYIVGTLANTVAVLEPARVGASGPAVPPAARARPGVVVLPQHPPPARRDREDDTEVSGDRAADPDLQGRPARPGGTGLRPAPGPHQPDPAPARRVVHRPVPGQPQGRGPRRHRPGRVRHRVRRCGRLGDRDGAGGQPHRRRRHSAHPGGAAGRPDGWWYRRQRVLDGRGPAQLRPLPLAALLCPRQLLGGEPRAGPGQLRTGIRLRDVGVQLSRRRRRRC